MPSLLSYLFKNAAPALARGQERRYALGEQQRQEAVRQAEQERTREADLKRLMLQQALGYSQQFQQQRQFEEREKAAAEQRAVENERNRIEDARRASLDAATLGYRTAADLRAERAADISDQRLLLAQQTAERAGRPKPEKLRVVPGSVTTSIIHNERQLDVIDDALSKLNANPKAVGLKNKFLPDAAVQRLPYEGFASGRTTRNEISDIGSLEIKDRSGATVPRAEMERLGFIPNVNDSADAAREKLERLKRYVENQVFDMREAYGEDAGYHGVMPRSRPRAGDSTGPQNQAKPNPSQTKRRPPLSQMPR